MLYKNKLLICCAFTIFIATCGALHVWNVLGQGSFTDEDQDQTMEQRVEGMAAVQDEEHAEQVALNNWRQRAEKWGQGAVAQFLRSFFVSPAALIVGKERKSGNSDFSQVLQSPELNAFIRAELIKIKKLFQQKIQERMANAAPLAGQFLSAIVNRARAGTRDGTVSEDEMQ